MRPDGMDIWAVSFSTLAKIEAKGTSIRAICEQCRGCWDLDVDRLIAEHGADFSLIDRRGRCRTPGWTRRPGPTFQVSMGPYSPFQPLLRRR